MTLPINLSNKLRIRFYPVAILIALSAMHLPTSVVAEENKYEGPLQDTNENAEQLIRELKEVTEKYPVLSQRFGLVKIPDYRVPMLCVGGVDVICHQETQNSCIQNPFPPGTRPDYNHCLDLANKLCCLPAPILEIEFE